MTKLTETYENATITLVHDHYDPKHLAEVKEKMKKLGAPVIRAIWSESNGSWAAFEGCHRIRAAFELKLIPEIIELTEDDEIIDENYETVTGLDILESCQYVAARVDFEELEYLDEEDHQEAIEELRKIK